MDRLVKQNNHNGDITNSGLDMAPKVLGWLVLEACIPLKWEHGKECSDNMPTVAWATNWASKRLRMVKQLLMVLATHMRKNRASHLVTKHITGKQNILGDFQSKLFGYNAKWHFVNDSGFLAFFYETFPPPYQNFWTGSCLKDDNVTKGPLELLIQRSSIDE